MAESLLFSFAGSFFWKLTSCAVKETSLALGVFKDIQKMKDTEVDDDGAATKLVTFIGLCRSVCIRAPVMASTEVDDDGAATKLVTFIGKGGSGKTAAAIFAAQGMKLLPTGQKSSLAIFLYSSAIGFGAFLLRYIPSLVRSILTELGLEEDMYNPLAIFLVTFVAIAGAWLGFWVVRKLVLTED